MEANRKGATTFAADCFCNNSSQGNFGQPCIKMYVVSKTIHMCSFPFKAIHVCIVHIKTPIFRASRGKCLGPVYREARLTVYRIVKYTNLHINPVFGGRGKAPAR